MGKSGQDHDAWEMFPSADWQPIKYEIVRTPKDGRPIKPMFLSNHIWGRPIHYANKSGNPCFGDQCELCARAVKRDWKGYAFCMGNAETKVFILEFTAATACRAYEQYCKYRTLRGLHFTQIRNAAHETARILIEFGKKIEDPGTWPKVPDIRKTMFGIWKVKDPAPEQAATVDDSTPAEVDLVREGIRKHLSLPGQTFIQNGRE